jgi:hypothetical protein
LGYMLFPKSSEPCNMTDITRIQKMLWFWPDVILAFTSITVATFCFCLFTVCLVRLLCQNHSPKLAPAHIFFVPQNLLPYDKERTEFVFLNICPPNCACRCQLPQQWGNTNCQSQLCLYYFVATSFSFCGKPSGM